MRKSKVKTFVIFFLLAVVAICLPFALVACGNGDVGNAGTYGVGEEGVYYYEKDDATEYLMSLQSGNYMISADGTKGYAGTYSYDEKENSIAFREDDGGTFGANFSDDAMRLEIAGTPYTFLKQVKYTVTFVDGDSSVTESVTYGKKASVPAEDTSRIFIGWYTDPSFTMVYGFDTAITGDLTLYARYIDIDSTAENYEVQFVYGGDVIYTTTTRNGAVYDFPDVGDIVGWWVSDTNSEDELTYRYDGEILDESTTLFAVESAALGASVYGDGMTWLTSVTSATITVDGDVVTSNATGTSFSYDFASLSVGRHEITISGSGVSETRVYVARGLARVSNFEVYGNVLVYNAVANAQYYRVSVECGNPAHEHIMVYNGSSLTYDFSNCEMGPDGIKFTVYAYASGYFESVSDTFVYALVLGKTSVTIDAASDTASWTAVTGATGYEVYVNGEYADTVLGTSYSFKYEAQGAEIEIAVKPVAPGYYSETSASEKYTKATLATPEITSVLEYTISWADVGAVSYELNINGYLILVEGTTYALSDTDVEHISDVNMNAISVTAVGSTASENSQRSDIYYMTDKTMYSALTYADGVITWIYALAADSYVVSYEGATETVSGVNSHDITFTHSGENVIDVYFMLDGAQSAMAEISVTTYAIVFDSRGGDAVDTMYVAGGDRVFTETPGYSVGRAEFKGWYTLPDLTADENATSYAGDGVEFVSGTRFGYSGTLVLYAFWTNQQIAVTLNAGADGMFRDDEGNELGSVITEYVSFNSSSFTLPVPENVNGGIAYFTGWYTSEVGGVQYTDADGKATVRYNNSNVTTLYAHWGEVISLSVTTSVRDNTKKVLAVSKGDDITAIPDGVLTIEEEYTVDGVTYPVGYVGSAAFNGCTTLTEINLPDTVEYISTTNGGYTSGSGAFAGCSNLKAVNIYATGIEEQDTTKEITYYSADGVLFEKDDATGELTLIYYPHAKADATYTVPSSVSNESEYALEGAEAVKVEGHPVTKLADGAFSAGTFLSDNWMQMTEVVIPASVTIVGMQCFYYSDNILKITFLEADAGTTASLTIGDEAFARCSNLVDITLPSHLISFNTTMFEYCSSLTEIKITEGGIYSSTSSSDATTEGLVCTDGGATVIYCLRYRSGDIVIGSPVNKIAENAFKGCIRITSVTIGASVVTVGQSAFQGCTAVTEVVFEGNDQSQDLTIEAYAFYGLTNNEFTEITLPSNLVKMEEHAFGGCTNLVTVRFDGRDTGTLYATYELDFATGAFASDSGTYYVKTLYLGAHVPYFAFTGVFGNALSNVYIDENNLYFGTGEDGVVYNATKTEIYFYPDDLEGTYELPYGLERIGDNVFSMKTNLTGITIPSTVTYIGYQAFYGCTALAYVTFTSAEEDAEKNGLDTEDADGVQSLVIGDRAFYNCTSLTEITIPARVTMMGEYDSVGKLVGMNVFTGCSNLATINVETGSRNFTTSYGILYLVTDGEPTELILSPRQNTAAQGELVIPSTVTKIWNRAFYYNRGITKISFENDTATNGLELDEQITTYSGVTEIVLPTGLEAIPYESFYFTSGLTSVTIPYTVTTIDTRAFCYCFALATVTFTATPDGVSEVPLEFVETETTYGAGGHFYGTAVTELVLPDRTTTLSEYALYGMASLQKITIGANVAEIPEYCFQYDAALSEVTFSGGENSRLAKIDEYAFSGCGAMSLVMPANLETIESNAFSSSGVTSVTFNKKLKSIGSGAFSGCSDLAAVTFGEAEELDMTLALSIGSSAFSGTAVTSVTFPYYVTEIGGFSNTALTEAKFAENIPDGYVSGTEDGQESHTIVISGSAFANCAKLASVAIPAYVQSVGASAFSGCTALKTVTFSGDGEVGSLESIGANAFLGCTSLESVTFPAGLRSIGESSFSGCTSLSYVTFETDETTGCAALEEIGSYAFQDTAITEFVFPEVELTQSFMGFTLGDSIFRNCPKLRTVTLSNGVTELGTSLNACYSIREIKISDTNTSYKASESNSSVIYSYDGISIVYVCGEVAGALVIEEGVVSIGDGIFQYQNTLTSVTIPSTVASIGAYAFYGCTALKSVTFSAVDDTALTGALTTIGEGAFMYCTALTYVKIPVTVTTLGTKVFYGDTALTYAEFETESDGTCGLTTLGTYTFYKCTALEEIIIPAGVSLYDSTKEDTSNSKNYSYDFEGCSALKKVVFLSAPDEIGTDAFYNCTSLKTVGVGTNCKEGVADLSLMTNTYFAGYAFTNSGVEKVILPAHDYRTAKFSTTNQTAMFQNCHSLEEIEFSAEGTTYLASGMFYNCDALKSVELSENITFYSATSYSGGAFANCSSLEYVVSGGAKITAYIFYGCSSLKTVAENKSDLDAMSGIADLRNDVTFSSSKYAFYNCSSLEFVILPDNCNIPEYMFYGCSSLKTVTSDAKYKVGAYTRGVADISDAISLGQYAFATSGVESVLFPAVSGTSYSGVCVFADCASLASVTFSDGATTLNKAAFLRCTALESVTIPSGVSITAGSGTSDSSQGAFAYSGLKTVYVEGTPTFGAYAFYGCEGLYTLAQITSSNYTTDTDTGETVIDDATINEGVIDLRGLSLDKFEFEYCSSITTVYISSGLATLPDSYVFGYCTSLTTVATFYADTAESDVMDGVVDISSVTTIGTYAFRGCESIEKVLISSSLTTFKTDVFRACTSLTTVATDKTWLSDVTYEGFVDLSNIGTYATDVFHDCPKIEKVLTKNVSNSFEISDDFFDGCESLTTISSDINDLLDSTYTGTADLTPFSKIGNYAFQKTAIVNVIYGADSNTSKYGKFMDCTKLETVTFTQSTTIVKAAFAGCVSLATVKVSDDFDTSKTISVGAGSSSDATSYNQGAFAGCTSLTTFDVPVASVENYMFYGCSPLTSISVPDGVKSIGTYAFYGCESLASVTLPDTVTSVGTYAFYGNTALTNVNLNKVTSVGSYAFCGAGLSSVEIPSALTTVSTYAFYGCENLASVTLSDSTTKIDTYAFYGCKSLTTINLNKVTSVGAYAFCGTGLTSLNIPSALDTIEACAFTGCDSLTNVTVESGNNRYNMQDGLLVNYVDSAVVYCPAGLTEVVIPEGIVAVSEYAFYGANVSSVKLSGTTETIGRYAFAYCKATTVDLTPSKVLDAIGDYAFYMSSVENVSIPVSVSSIGSYAFAGQLTVTVSTTSSAIEVTAKNALSAVTFTEAQEGEVSVDLTIGNYAFAASSLTSVTFPDRATSVGTYVLAGTESLTAATLGSGITSVPQGFAFGSGVQTVTMSDAVTSIGSYAFWGCKSLASLSIPENVTTIDQFAFAYCEALKELTIPAAVTSMGNYAFAYSGLESVTIEEGVTTLGTGTNLFTGTKSLDSVTLPSTLETISGADFADSGLSSIVIPRNVSSIANSSFADWTSAKTIFLEFESEYESLHSVGDSNTGSTGTTLGYEQWRKDCEALVCYYSDTESDDTSHSYWHYDDGVPAVWDIA